MLKRIENFPRISRRRLRALCGTVVGALAVGALLLSPTAAAQSPKAPSTFSVLYTFQGGTNGAYPGNVFVDKAGNLFGVTEAGGNLNLCRGYEVGPGCGAVYEIDSTGKFTLLHDFAENTSDGYGPSALLQDSAGTLYGTNGGGGTYGYGTLYKLDASGQETVLHSFGGPGDAAYPGVLIIDAQGNLYGGTGTGGAYGGGTLYELDTSGNYTVLFNFNNTDGTGPTALVRDSAGNFYGTTIAGGAYLKGVVFELDSSGVEKVLYTFTGGADGGQPNSLLLGPGGNMYGTTSIGGNGCQDSLCGVVFKLSPAGVETVLHAFGSSPQDGIEPNGLILGADNELYGATCCGGTGGARKLGHGTIFRISLSGNETVVYDFPGGADGFGSFTGLARDAAGNLYGASYQGGRGIGLVYKFVP